MAKPNPLEGKKGRLSELVDYQEGSVVSRTIIKRPGGTVTLFAFAAGESLSEHTAPFDALVEILDGEAEITVDGKKHVLAAGEALNMPPNIPHALKAAKRFKMLLTLYRVKE